MQNIRFIDLFSGIGAFHQAFKGKNAICVMASEIDKHCIKQYSANYGIIPQGDIREIDEHDIPAHDVLCAGFPCQPFSIAGKKAGFFDNRGDLFFEVIRIAKFHKPKIILLENVKNIVTHDCGNTFKYIINELKKIGYNVNWKILNAVDFELPQKRERVYIVATLNKKKYLFPKKRNNIKVIKDIIQNDDVSEYIIPEKKLSNLTINDDVSEKIITPTKIGQIKKGGQGDRIYSSNSVGITISASSGGTGAKTGLYYIDGQIRKLTPRESAFLQGFPEDYKIIVSNSQAYKQFGNTIPVNVIRAIIVELYAQNFLRENNE